MRGLVRWRWRFSARASRSGLSIAVALLPATAACRGQAEDDGRNHRVSGAEIEEWFRLETEAVCDRLERCATEFVQRLPEADQRRFVDRVVERVPKPVTADYVRLNVEARRP